jgi:hypothetical protein
MIITFTDDTMETPKGDTMDIGSDLLTVGFKASPSSYGVKFADGQWTAYPLCNIKSFHWGNM